LANTDIRAAGLNGGIVLNNPISSGGTLVAAKTQFTFAATRDFFDGSAFSDTNKRWFAGLRDAQGTYAGLLDLSGDLLFEAAALGAQLLYLYADTGAGASSLAGAPYEVAHGSGFLDATVDVNLNDMCKVTGAFRAAANWTFTI
jgi:hypothetical protein